MKFTTSSILLLIFVQGIAVISAADTAVMATTDTSSKSQNEHDSNGSLKKHEEEIDQLMNEDKMIITAVTSSPTTSANTVEYELSTKLKFDWKVNDKLYFTLLNNEEVKGVVTFVDPSISSNNRAYISGDIIEYTSKTGKEKNDKVLGDFSAAYYIDSISANIRLSSQLGFLYELVPAVKNKSNSPSKKTYTMTKKDYASFPPDGEQIPPMLKRAVDVAVSVNAKELPTTTTTVKSVFNLRQQ